MNEQKPTAILLAAGVSRRLYPLTYQNPKCLLEIGGKPIIDWQLEALKSIGVKNIVLVVGYFHEKIISHVHGSFPELQFTFVLNEHFFETNTAFSLSLCSSQLSNNTTLLFNGDVMFPVELVKRLVKNKHENVFAVEEKQCGKEEVKVVVDGDSRITAIGKELIQENTLGEFIGVAKFSQEFGKELATSLHRLVEAGGKTSYFEAAIQPLLGIQDVYYEDISDLPCIEVDFRDDLEEAQELARSDWYRNGIKQK